MKNTETRRDRVMERESEREELREQWKKPETWRDRVMDREIDREREGDWIFSAI